MIGAWCRWWRGKVMVGTIVTAASTPFLLVHLHLPAWALVGISVIAVSGGVSADMIAESVLSRRRLTRD